MALHGRWGDRTRSALQALIVAMILAGVPVSALAARHADARHKPGPVFIRGIAVSVSATRFTLNTTSHGTYTVQVSRDTSITEKGKQGRQSVRDGEHVGVHGFVEGRNIRAIYVHIYPSHAQPKGYSLKGTVRAIGQGYFLLSTGKGVLRVLVGPGSSVRLGSKPATIRDLKVGEQVRVHVYSTGHEITATSVHIYHQVGAAPSVQVQGTVIAVSRGSITVRQGGHAYHIALAGTVVYLGASRVSPGSLHPGQWVRVYACCQGQPLVAHSIHIRKTPVHRVSVLVRGIVRTVDARLILVITSGHGTPIALNAGTIFELGSARIGWSGIRAGDQVSIRAYRSGGALIATRVHVYASSREVHTLVGVVLHVTATRLTVRARGKQYTVVLAAGVALTIGGRTGTAAAVRAGDHIRAVGHLTGQTLEATRISVTRPAPATHVIHGIVTALSSGAFWLTDSRGRRYHVRSARGVYPTAHGARAPADALFVGVHATVRGTIANGVLVASSVALSLGVRTVSGRVAAVRGGTLRVARSSVTSYRVDVPSTLRVSDGSNREPASALHQGAYVRVRGYAEDSGNIRASHIGVRHPSLDITGTVVALTPELVMQTSAGERFRLAFAANSVIRVQRTQIAVARADIGAEAHVHVLGKARSDGSLAVKQLAVRLASVTLRGKITALGSHRFSLAVIGGTEQIQQLSGISITQGSRSITFDDLVTGDDLTVYGYRSGRGLVLARKLEVHRKLVGLDGFVSATDPQGFTLTLTSGTAVPVRTDATTQVSGGVIAVGLDVHVTGYQRGDGAVLAMRVKVGKPHRAFRSLSSGRHHAALRSVDPLADIAVLDKRPYRFETLYEAHSILVR